MKPSSRRSLLITVIDFATVKFKDISELCRASPTISIQKQTIILVRIIECLWKAECNVE